MYKSPASISSEFLSDMISKLIEDTGVDDHQPKDLNNNFKQEQDDNDSAISPLGYADIEDDGDEDALDEEEEEEEDPVVSDITKSEMAIKISNRGNPIGPATVGLALLIPSSFSADIIKGSFLLC